MSQVLVLNASYEPLNITTWRRAIVMMMKGKAESLEEDTTHLVREDTLLPTVIRLRKFVHVPFRELSLTRKNVLHRDGFKCQYCGNGAEQKLSIDHVMPRSRGGLDIWENVTTACLACNAQKGNKTPQEANMTLSHIPKRPIGHLTFETRRQINSGKHKEWSKYLIDYK